MCMDEAINVSVLSLEYLLVSQRRRRGPSLRGGKGWRPEQVNDSGCP
jgi:hypothetical protein